ncbi:MAG: hypothetical protein BVN35_07735 [Proteobacteria bacterium ST_bin11]|nr:MAG: hypothetical protein BVN35_07735 [Proteobacteria bacterium ST_bin11]
MTTENSASRKGISQKTACATGIKGPGLFDHGPNYRLTSSEQFPLHIAKRIKASLILARAAHYLTFVYGGGPVQITVTGAKFQDRTCAAGNMTRDSLGRIQYSGLQAGHVRLGSYLINGNSVASEWYYKFSELAAKRGINKAEAGESLLGHGHFTALSLIFEGVTNPVDAMVNQVFGTIESRLHPKLNLLNLTSIPKKTNILSLQMRLFSDEFMQSVPKELLRIAKDMAEKIKREPVKERTQKDVEIDGHGPAFKFQGELLKQFISELESANSHTNQKLVEISGDIIKAINFDMPLVALAKDEAQSY